MISQRKRSAYEDLINNPYYQIEETGTIIKQCDGAGNVIDGWREQKTYITDNRLFFKYKSIDLNMHLAVLAKHDRLPSNEEMVVFKDGNISNCDIANLEIIPKSYKRNQRGQFKGTDQQEPTNFLTAEAS